MLNVLELFGGIGAPRKALERLGIDFKVVDYVDIDKYAVKSYNAIYNENYEPQDITKWDKQLDVDLIFHGSPCQDFSLAGKQAGGDKDSGTRSSLLYETVRIVSKLKPKYVIWENVKNVISKKHRHNFDNYLNGMTQLGYTNYYQVLNAKDYGIPQNRERVFTVSILGKEDFSFPQKQNLETLPIDYIEDNVDEKYDLTDKNKLHYQREFGSKGKELNLFEPIPTLTSAMGTGGGNIPYFQFPPKQELKLRLKDMLETEVDEKYYLSNKMIDYIIAEPSGKYTNSDIRFNRTIANTLNTGNCGQYRASIDNYLIDNIDKEIILKKDTENYIEWEENGKLDSNCRAYKEDKVIGTITTTPKNKVLLTPKVINPLKDKTDKSWQFEQQVYDIDGITRSVKAGGGSGNIPKILIKEATKQGYKEAHEGDSINLEQLNSKTRRGRVGNQVAQTLNTGCNQATIQNLRIRKLTPLECWRLMGFDDIDFEKASQVNSNAQLYKQAGNSIVVNVLENIFKELL